MLQKIPAKELWVTLAGLAAVILGQRYLHADLTSEILAGISTLFGVNQVRTKAAATPAAPPQPLQAGAVSPAVEVPRQGTRA